MTEIAIKTTEHPERGRIYHLVRRIENEVRVYRLQIDNIEPSDSPEDQARWRALSVATAGRIGALGAGLRQEMNQPTDAHLWCRLCYAEYHEPGSVFCGVCSDEAREEAWASDGPDDELEPEEEHEGPSR